MSLILNTFQTNEAEKRDSGHQGAERTREAGPGGQGGRRGRPVRATGLGSQGGLGGQRGRLLQAAGLGGQDGHGGRPVQTAGLVMMCQQSAGRSKDDSEMLREL